MRVLDIGSLDVNGTNRYLFDNCDYTGLDLLPGKNVDVACKAHEFQSPSGFDTIISTEVLEHDIFFRETLKNAWKLLRADGLLVITCATTGREPHGTAGSLPEQAPFLAKMGEEWAGYYRNVTAEDVFACLPVSEMCRYCLEIHDIKKDLYFWAIKKPLRSFL